MKSVTAKKKSKREHESTDQKDLKNLWHRLETKGLLQTEDASLSFRLPGQQPPAFLLIDRKKGKGAEVNRFTVHDPAASINAVAVDSERSALIHFHASIYRHRSDIGAIACFQPIWGSLLKTLKDPLPLVFDEQCRQLGAPVVQMNRSSDGSAIADSVLLGGANAFLNRDGVVITSVTREKAIYNCELIEKCAKAFLLAYATGGKIRRIPWFVRWIAKNRLIKDERRAAASYALGQAPTGFTAY
ncbi:class II aldolase/adducin N-terminal domain protein [Leptospira inadai serovar Lyme str. 10]|uniref:Class II aldolase/adducin N-terminal domain protein n=2 Tax=Leptospira inadai serovar Lyme TaxID=293084 RepID=V6HBG9_9LEPT|nr:class II aldolase/adducin family protein [Leptospira inadai]EQA36986.1 class II aldolase/adducin N-terminal domain protein [Leptospira inadai serovar Lyme str. 10]PNV75595.1 aldose epimerase [Leptospira inadai serovar Lyme]